MLFARVNTGGCVKFPYTQDTLQEENPYTAFDFSVPLPELFAPTEAALTTGDEIVEVVMGMNPGYVTADKEVVQATTLTLIDDVWTLGWDIVAKTGAALAEAEAVTRKQVDDKIDFVVAGIEQEIAENTALTAEQVQTQRDYITALRAVPQQPNYPWTVVYPSPPNTNT
jgi:hypothetical protein